MDLRAETIWLSQNVKFGHALRDVEDHLGDRPSVEEIEVDLAMKHNDKHHTALLARVSKFCLPRPSIALLIEKIEPKRP